VAANVSQALPLVDLQTASRVSTVVLYLWPVAVTVVAAALRWKRLSSGVAFLVLGYLTCLGVEALVRKFGFVIYWTHYSAEVPEDQAVAYLVNAVLSIALLGTVLSVAPVWWLTKLLSRNYGSAAT
jgi:hypothetical protein